jgi:hypothetical protein
MAGSPETVDGKYLFLPPLPMAAPKDVAGKAFYGLGYVSKSYVRQREESLLLECNRHIYDTVIRDRKALLEKLAADREALGKGVLERIEALKLDNARLSAEYGEYRSRMEADGR